MRGTLDLNLCSTHSEQRCRAGHSMHRTALAPDKRLALWNVALALALQIIDPHLALARGGLQRGRQSRGAAVSSSRSADQLVQQAAGRQAAPAWAEDGSSRQQAAAAPGCSGRPWPRAPPGCVGCATAAAPCPAQRRAGSTWELGCQAGLQQALLPNSQLAARTQHACNQQLTDRLTTQSCLSCDPVTRRLPSGNQAAQVTGSRWWRSTLWHVPLATSHRRSASWPAWMAWLGGRL